MNKNIAILLTILLSVSLGFSQIPIKKYRTEIEKLENETQINKYWNDLHKIDQEILVKTSDLKIADSISISNMIKSVLIFNTHGVTHHTSNLTYSYESGALNESFSDIFGTVIQAVMMDNGNTDWIQGNFVASTIEEMRSLQSPNDFGVHYDASGTVVGQPDTYNGTFWYAGAADNGGVHINSGVMNKWFYLLSDGEQGTNDLNNFYDIQGIGMTRAARIAYLAQTSILQNSSQYTDARQATISAAVILFGECSFEHQQTIDAWFAVGIGNLNDCEFTLGSENVAERDLLIYPNPTSHSLNIELPVLTSEKIQIFNVSGKLVQEFETDNLVTQTDISKLQNGVYTIRFDFNSELINKRFIVQK